MAMTTLLDPGARRYSKGVSDEACEITHEMRELMEANSRALQNVRATKKSTYSHLPSLHEG
jgi:hypothetical protein